MRKRYMHIINGRPAAYDGHQVCYLTSRFRNPLRDTLDEIRREQRASAKWRQERGYSPTTYDHIMFYEVER